LGMLKEQQRVWQAYPESLRAKIHVIVVDDCSPKGVRPSPKAVTVSGLGSFRIYRLVEKIRWNWLACRNLGARLATTDWLLLTDIDHVVPVETAARLVHGELKPDYAYRFSRADAPHQEWWTPSAAPCDVCAARTREYREQEEPCRFGPLPPYRSGHVTIPYKLHNDSWLLTKALFYFDDGQRFVQGYDERLSGCYGTSGEFRDRVFACAEAYKQLPDVLVRYPREVIPDASTPPEVYTRKGDPVNDEDLKRRKSERAQIEQWRPLHGLVPYEEIYNSVAVEAVA
jgi:hypothetical protein